MRDVDELILVDIAASKLGRSPNAQGVAEFSSYCFVPLTVGGGVRSLDDFTALLHAGADKVSVNSAAFDDPGLIDAAAGRFGAQCVVASIDCRRDDAGVPRCVSHAGSNHTGRDPVEWARELADRGAGEILLTSVERDGEMSGYDVDLIASVASAVNVSVIASGGAGALRRELCGHG